MVTRTPVKPAKDVQQVQGWSLLTRAAFRFCFVYFGLYCLATPIVGGLILFPGFSFPSFGALWPMRQITFWLATNLFRVTTPLVFTGNSGDTTFHWVQTCWLLLFSALAAGIWYRLDRACAHDIALNKWFRLFV